MVHLFEGLIYFAVSHQNILQDLSCRIELGFTWRIDPSNVTLSRVNTGLVKRSPFFHFPIKSFEYFFTVPDKSWNVLFILKSPLIHELVRIGKMMEGNERLYAIFFELFAEIDVMLDRKLIELPFRRLDHASF